FADDGRQVEDRVIVDYCAQNSLYRFQRAMTGAIDNFPIVWARLLMRFLVFPLGARFRPASDELGAQVTELALTPGEVRDRLTRYVHITEDPDDAVGLLEYALPRVLAADKIARKIDKAVRKEIIERFHDRDWIEEAVEKDVITAEEAAQYREANALLERVVEVDHFAPEAVKPHYRTGPGSNENRPAMEAAE
ncbi:MAG: acyl-CoA dehydrogenase domain-containing protein, partial [Hyphomicrobiaceae bacterium]